MKKNAVSQVKQDDGNNANKVMRSKEEVIIVHQKNATQTSETTKKICKEKIRNGGIAIICKRKEEIQKMNA